MATGLIALLDDVAAIAKVAAASLDDIGTQAAKAGMKAAGVVIDDAAVAPSYVVGFAASRELPIVGRIAVGSLKNKLIFLLPIALALGWLAPWAITPLLMLGGAYLSYEGAEKILEALHLVEHHGPARLAEATSGGGASMEDKKVTSAIQTDFILSAEIMALTLAALPPSSLFQQAVVLALVGIGITLVVYGAVAIIVKTDDVGLYLAKQDSALLAGLGRLIVRGMPGALRLLAIIGTAAMVWVGGGIIIHGLESFGLAAPAHLLHDWSEAAGRAVPGVAGIVAWLVTAIGSGLVGLALGVLLVPLVGKVLAPLAGRLRSAFSR